MKPKLAAALLAASAAVAIAATPAPRAAADDLELYKQMLADPFANPGWLWADDGEALWNTPAGPKNATLADCDLGLGPGVVEGAYAQLPRYFADVDAVMDAETRIKWCRETLQGIPAADQSKAAFSKRGARSEMEQLVTYVAVASEGMPFAPPMDHPREQAMFALGEALFYRRAGAMDYSCNTCHSADGARIRLQELPNLQTNAGAVSGTATWPAYRVSQETVRTMQHRMADCLWQMRLPDVAHGSEVTIALISYLTKTAEGGAVAAPALKR